MTASIEQLEEELRRAVLIDKTMFLRVDIILRKLLGCREPRAAQLVVELVHGKRGAEAARAAWKQIQAGIPLHNDAFVSQGTTRYSLAARCLMHGTVATFESLVLAGVPDVVPEDLKPRNQTEWMDLLCSTNSERLAHKLELMTRPDQVSLGAVGEIATFADVSPECAQEAFEVVWRLAPHHPGFDALARESSEPGAAVRTFLMSKRMVQVAQELPVVEAPVAPPWRRRASI